MDRIGKITLIYQLTTRDQYGIRKVSEETSRDVLCNVSSVSAREMHDASQIGATASLRAEMYASEYNGELLAEYEGVRYRIYRTYLSNRNQDRVELYLEERAGDGSD